MALRIAMDELVVVGGVGELVDHALRDHPPRRYADFFRRWPEAYRD
jgi:hypothetical protein